MKSLFKYIVYGSWWVALCAGCLGLLSWFELTGSWWNAPLFVFTLGSTLVIYNLNMLSGLEELRELGTDSERHHWCMENEKLMKATLGLGLLMAATSVWFLNWHIWLFMIPLTLVALSYAAPIVRRRTEFIRTREIGLWKIFLIAIVWSGMTVVLPAVNYLGLAQVKEPNSWWLAFERGLFILAITIPFDIRDLINDAKKGVTTIPSTIGWFRSLLLAEIVLILFLFLVWWRSANESNIFFGYLIATLLTMLGVSYAHPKRNDMYCSFWIEGTMLLLFFMVYYQTEVV